MNDNMMTDSDHEAILRCQKGDADAFEDIVRKYQKKMFNVALMMIGDYNDAAEVVQDAFVSAYRNIKKFKGESKFSTWLYTIVVNHSKNRQKKNRKQSFHEHYSVDDPIDTEGGKAAIDPVSEGLSVLEKLEKRDLSQKVRGCINTLEDDFKQVIVLRDMEGFSYDEIAKMLNISEGTVKSRIHRARESVKNCLKRFIGEF